MRSGDLEVKEHYAKKKKSIHMRGRRVGEVKKED